MKSSSLCSKLNVPPLALLKHDPKVEGPSEERALPTLDINVPKLGNTKRPESSNNPKPLNEVKESKKKKFRESGPNARNWCFTNYDIRENNKEDVKWYDHNEISYIICGLEKGNKEDHFHHQGYLQLKSKKRLGWIKNNLSNTAHFEPQSKESSSDQARIYCTPDYQGKQDTKIFLERGIMKKQGQDCKIASALDDIKNGRLDYKMTSTYTKHHSGLDKQLAFWKKTKARNLAEKEFDIYFKGLNHHQKFWEWLRPRRKGQILAIVNRKGGLGKSTYADYLEFKHNAIILDNASTRDIAQSYDYQNTIVFDYARSKEGIINYTALEHLLNGRIYNPKYEGAPKRFPKPEIIVCTNFALDWKEMSTRKWFVLTYAEDKLLSIKDGENRAVDVSKMTYDEIILRMKFEEDPITDVDLPELHPRDEDDCNNFDSLTITV